jgi:hypothetical protein
MDSARRSTASGGRSPGEPKGSTGRGVLGHSLRGRSKRVYCVYGGQKRPSGAKSTGKLLYCVHGIHSVFFQLQPNCSRLSTRKGDSTSAFSRPLSTANRVGYSAWLAAAGVRGFASSLRFVGIQPLQYCHHSGYAGINVAGLKRWLATFPMNGAVAQNTDRSHVIRYYLRHQ